MGIGAHLLEDLGDPEVEHLHDRPRLVAREEDVVGLEIAVNDAQALRPGEGAAHAGQHQRRRREAEHTLAVEALRQGLAVEAFHGDVGDALVNAVIEDLDDVAAAEPRGGLRFAEEASEHARALRHRGWMSLMATGVPSDRCSARQTTPIPPRPIIVMRR